MDGEIYMKTITINNQFNKETQFYYAIENSHDGDTIVLTPGTYFADHPFSITIKHNLTIIGSSTNLDSVIMNCAFIIGGGNTVFMKNLTLNFTDDKFNTLAIYDKAEFYGENVHINHDNKYEWDTIYSKNSTISLTNSVISSHQIQGVALNLEDSQIILDHSKVDTLYLKKSECNLNGSTINVTMILSNKSSVHFSDLTINSPIKRDSKDLYAYNNSHISGSNLIFTNNYPIVEIHDSSVKLNQIKSNMSAISWQYEGQSDVTVDDVPPFNEGPDIFED